MLSTMGFAARRSIDIQHAHRRGQEGGCDLDSFRTNAKEAVHASSVAESAIWQVLDFAACLNLNAL